ncbi:GntR family transcriptional regulator [Pseudonocardia sp. NPDC049635]|uniref:GntR family transcriptional regulator n=1 Tax=Pseudonocardia sp. NPDC049635 TaxID=3155506 RepID=UPI0033C7FF57
MARDEGPAAIRAGRRIADPPSMVALAADALRRMIFDGELAPGERMVEYRLADQLAVSRPPVREALRLLEREGLVVQVPRRGASVRALSLQDVYEITTLRTDLETMAIRLGVPVQDERVLAPLAEATRILEVNARRGAEDSAVEDTIRFHRALVALAGHGRLDEAYHALSLQLWLLMAMNRRARSSTESLVERAQRHRALFDLVRAGDADAVLAALHDGSSLSMLRLVGPLISEDGSPAAHAWFERVRERGTTAPDAPV